MSAERDDFCSKCGTAPCQHPPWHPAPQVPDRSSLGIALVVGLFVGLIVGLMVGGWFW